MKNIMSVIFFTLLVNSTVFANESNDPKPRKRTLENGAICVRYDTGIKKWIWFPEDKLSSAGNTFDSNKGLIIGMKKGNECNLYLGWLNPLRYQIAIEQHQEVDPRDEAINDFIGQFSSLILGSNALGSKGAAEASDPDMKQFQTAIEKEDFKVKNPGATQDSINAFVQPTDKQLTIPSGFSDVALNMLYLQVIAAQPNLTPSDIDKIDPITKKLTDLEAKDLALITKDVKEAFEAMSKVDYANDLAKPLKNSRADLVKWKQTILDANNLAAEITTLVKTNIISNAMVNSIFGSTIADFVERSRSKIEMTSKLLDSFESVLDLLEKSTNDPSPGQKPFDSDEKATRYYKFPEPIEFEEGNIAIVKFIIKERTIEFGNDKIQVITGKEVGTAKITFEQYSSYEWSTSAGLFYSNTNLQIFGVGTDANGSLIITEDSIQKGSASPAAFLNLSFPVSRYFAPLAQLGIDPTKKRPFLLVGGGFAIPSAKFALTAGGIWTFTPTLNNLSVGQSIASTTTLENDIKYNFEIVPKGWYIGFQFNFGTLSSFFDKK